MSVRLSREKTTAAVNLRRCVDNEEEDEGAAELSELRGIAVCGS